MFRSFKIAYSLLVIPRLFAHLLLFPWILSVLLIIGQISVSIFAFQQFTRNSDDTKEIGQFLKDNNAIRQFLYHSGALLPEIKICRWIERNNLEVPASRDCWPDPLDVSLHVSSPETFDPKSYLDLFNGNSPKIHICKSNCKTDLVIFPEHSEPRTDIHSIWGVALHSLSLESSKSIERYIEASKEKENKLALFGTTFFKSKSFIQDVRLDDFAAQIIFVFNVGVTIVITLWLAIRAHRRVLDYFARNGALLPIVSSCKSGPFYGAIWLITIARVLLFLAASIPLIVASTLLMGDEQFFSLMFNGDKIAFLVWAMTLLISFSLAGVIASIGELKHRHSVFSFTYLYIPLIVCALGAMAWFLTFLFEAGHALSLRQLIACLPLAGMYPILVAPIFVPQYEILAAHAVLSFALLVLLVKANTRWFESHLEEL